MINKEVVISTVQFIFMVLMIVVAMLILADFEFSSQTLTQKVDSKNIRLENRQSTGRNYYYATHLNAGAYRIPVSDDFSEATALGHTIVFEKSFLFNEVNNVSNIDAGISEKFSFRWMTGCIIPLFAIVVLVLGMKRREKLNTLVFVTEVVLLIDFIFLLN